MPNCLTCAWRDGTTCRAHEQAKIELRRPLPPPPTGACTIAIVDAYLPTIKAGMSVLEIGCGSWAKVRNRCVDAGAHYEGLDVIEEYFGEKSIATRFENLAALSFPDATFDVIIGNQTMEHWGEHGCTLSWGLYQCFRVLKPSGRLLLNVPIHFHGTKEFLHGRLTQLRALLNRFSKSVTFETWGSPTAPLPPYLPHADYPALADRPAYVLDIHAVRDRPLPHGVNNLLGFDGRLAQLVHYSTSFNFYRLRRKLRGANG